MNERSPITSHVLDTSRGKAASGISVTLAQKVGDQWQNLGQAVTNSDGRVETLLAVGTQLRAGVYRLRFEPAAYFRAQGTETFYPEIEVVFEVTQPVQHHHVPLLLSPFGYSTYRGT